MKKVIGMSFLLAFFWLAGVSAFASEAIPAKQGNRDGIGTVLKRGVINLVTFPGEVVRTVPSEREAHPKAWPVTYVPKMFLNLAVRLVSSVNDIGVLPLSMWATKDSRPITNFYDLPDYVWQKL